MKPSQRSMLPFVMVVLVGCANTNENSIADNQLQSDILAAIQTQYGKPGPSPYLLNCTFIDKPATEVYVEEWNVKLYGVRGRRDFTVIMALDKNGETDYSVLKKGEPYVFRDMSELKDESRFEKQGDRAMYAEFVETASGESIDSSPGQ